MVAEFVQGVPSVGPVDLEILERRVAEQSGSQASRRYLLDLLLSTDIEIARSIGGFAPDLRGRVRTRDHESAAETLVEMSTEYSRAHVGGDKQRMEDCRRAVRHAKDRLFVALRRKGLSAAKRKEKAEIREWFVVWLETPELFPDWIELRRRSRN